MGIDLLRQVPSARPLSGRSQDHWDPKRRALLTLAVPRQTLTLREAKLLRGPELASGKLKGERGSAGCQTLPSFHSMLEHPVLFLISGSFSGHLPSIIPPCDLQARPCPDL